MDNRARAVDFGRWVRATRPDADNGGLTVFEPAPLVGGLLAGRVTDEPWWPWWRAFRQLLHPPKGRIQTPSEEAGIEDLIRGFVPAYNYPSGHEWATTKPVPLGVPLAPKERKARAARRRVSRAEETAARTWARDRRSRLIEKFPGRLHRKALALYTELAYNAVRVGMDEKHGAFIRLLKELPVSFEDYGHFINGWRKRAISYGRKHSRSKDALDRSSTTRGYFTPSYGGAVGVRDAGLPPTPRARRGRDYRLTHDTFTCPWCGAAVPFNTRTCPRCGAAFGIPRGVRVEWTDESFTRVLKAWIAGGGAKSMFPLYVTTEDTAAFKKARRKKPAYAAPTPTERERLGLKSTVLKPSVRALYQKKAPYYSWEGEIPPAVLANPESYVPLPRTRSRPE